MTRLIIAFLVCLGTCAAQINDNAPKLIDSYLGPHIGSSTGVLDFIEPVTAGDLVGLAVNIAGNSAALTCSDTRGTTFSYTSPVVTPTPPDVTKITTGYFCYGLAGNSGAETITITGIGGTQPWNAIPFHFKNITATLDGTAQSNTLSGNPATISTSHTTTTTNDLILSFSFQSNYYQDTTSCTYPDMMASSFADAVPQTSMLCYQYTGVPGTYTPTHVISQHGGAQRIGIQSIAFKPTGLAVATTALPDGDVVSAYKATLVGVGGTAALTYAATGLPTGLSLNTSTGVISGTPGSVGTYTIGTTVTDGVTTSPTVNLTLKIGNSLSNPSIIASSKFTGNVSDSGLLTYQCGDLVIAALHADDTHTGLGWTIPGDGANTYLSLGGIKFKRFPVVQASFQAPMAVYYAQMTANGSGHITLTDTSTGSPLSDEYIQIRNGQPILDLVGANVIQPGTTSPIAATTSYATLVPNTLAIYPTATGNNGGGLDTITYAAPFSGLISSFQIIAGDTMAAGSNAFAAVSSGTTATSVTVGGGFPPIQDNVANLIVGVRPMLASSSPCAPAATGTSHAFTF